MQFSTSVLKIFLSVFALVFSVQVVLAAPAPVPAESLENRDVFVPPVIEPSENSAWTIGTTQTVTWDVSSPPSQITNKNGHIVLKNCETRRLDLDHPLASNFDILLGSYDVTVPEVTPGYYQVVLFGNSGNAGPTFRIIGDEPIDGPVPTCGWD
ncbi:hypothetical protein FA15DRAFT_341249 [Coprinopsis marcescibilis]|uniref:Yeast cell wall synthesis Kre9/Knh1-like N-terminal domain-containing protein n=1 Tax=Coprinopsis marcescibilis TaxID=230819 RepID=A0A5C3L0N7_COPMA|nr:hypothetical protein FA15DRAFT_341249 [Coprinopsis marcescibilis]